AVVSEIARRHGLTPQQVFGWRRAARRTVDGDGEAGSPRFVPAVVEHPKPEPVRKQRKPRRASRSTGLIEMEIGDLSRFENPRQLMAYLGLVPSERSTGETVRRGSITKAGNGRVRHMLVESAWTYRHPPKVGKAKLYKLEQTSPRVREIAWKAQTRLTARYRALSAKGKKTTIVCTAIARELVGFMWSVGQEVQPA
ncbi:MAG TPA: transposase, partial [Xanthobacteraceae bacterium]|nr:transposase [Xanthobacteraceae bacterium]